MKVKLVSYSKPTHNFENEGIVDAQELIAYCARVSNPSNQKVDNQIFNLVFGQFGIAMAASLFTYLVCQLIDIKIFHFWKKKTKGKYLWLRNKFSTIFSQLIDTFLILFLLMTLAPEKGLENWSDLKSLFINERHNLAKVIVVCGRSLNRSSLSHLACFSAKVS